MHQGRLTDSTVVIKYPMELLKVNLAIMPYRNSTLNLYSTFDPAILKEGFVSINIPVLQRVKPRQSRFSQGCTRRQLRK